MLDTLQANSITSDDNDAASGENEHKDTDIVTSSNKDLTPESSNDQENVVPLVSPSVDDSPPDGAPAPQSMLLTEGAGSELFAKEKQFDRAVLEKLVGDARQRADQNQKWYENRAQRMGKMSRSLRLAAIALGVFGGLCPLIPSNLLKTLGESVDSTLSSVGFVLFALAAATLVLDQAFGYSSSWMRSRLAELEMGRLIVQFTIESEAAFAGCQGARLSGTEARAILDQLKTFVAAMNRVVIGETETWISEFKSGLLQVEQITKAGTAVKK